MVKIFSKLRIANKPRFDIVESNNAKIILNYRYNSKIKASKKALLSYLVDPLINFQNKQPTLFSNHGLALSWAKLLNEAGYIVDVVNWDDKDFVPSQEYDLFVGHGAVNFDSICNKIKPTNPKVIYFSTGSYWKFHNQQEKDREDYFYQRHHKRISAGRRINNSEEKANKISDAIICLGNEHVIETYFKFDNIYNLNIATYSDDTFIKRKHNYNSAKKSFLFLAGGGNIHKGLDLVIDVFANLPEFELHIVTAIDEEFAKFYSKELELPNIHSYGYVPIKSKYFYDIAYKCNYLLFPSCSEGSPGSVVDAMQQGLIPVVTTESNIDIDNFGYLLDDYRLETIARMVKEISSIELSEVELRSRKAFEATTVKYSVDTFETKLSEILRKVLV